jgi:N-carbamoylputrescine amidase
VSPRANLRVAAVQQGPRSDDPARNLQELLEAIEEAAATRPEIIVVPELSVTPYFCGSSHLTYRAWAEAVPGRVTDAVADRARRYVTTIVLPLFVRGADGSYTNSAVVLGPDGRTIGGRLPGGGIVPYFSKVHLPRIESDTLVTDERHHFSAGDSFPVFRTPHLTLGVLICYDRRFPEAWRELVLAGAELVILPACVPAWDPARAASSAELFLAELRTRACENLLYVVACNRTGVEEFEGRSTRFVGQSCVIAPGGTVLAVGAADTPCVVHAEIDLEEVARVRSRLPLLLDRRPDAYVRLQREGARA